MPSVIILAKRAEKVSQHLSRDRRKVWRGKGEGNREETRKG